MQSPRASHPHADRKWCRMMRSISASVAKGWHQWCGQRCAAGLRLAMPKTGHAEKSRATDLGHNCGHAVGFPILILLITAARLPDLERALA